MDYDEGYTLQITHGTFKEQPYFWMSRYDISEKQFDNISDFLIWHFTPEETEGQKKIKELEATIRKAQEQIEELKRT